MKRFIKRFFQTLLVVILLLVITVLVIGRLENNGIEHRPTETKFYDVISLGVNGRNPRAVDIAMLGAHDAFSEKIKENGTVDPAESDEAIVRNGLVSTLLGGMIARLLKAQYSSADELFKKGVRYYDVRLSIYEDEWYTKHALLSDKLEVYLHDILTCLKGNPGEFIIFDMQHVYLEGTTYESLFSYLSNVKVDGKSLLDYVIYNTNNVNLSDLRYNDITDNGTKAGVVILAKCDKNASNGKHYVYSESMRSNWHEKNDGNELLSAIKSEYQAIISTHADNNKFRVNQAQLTGSYAPNKLFKTIKGWSLLNMAENFNAQILEEEELKKWFEAMPILMVDYADSTQNDFNEKINNIIIEYNKSLKISFY